MHSLIVEAVEKHAAYEEQMRSLVKEALAADAEIDRTGEVYRAEDVHAWAERIADGTGDRRADAVARSSLFCGALAASSTRSSTGVVRLRRQSFASDSGISHLRHIRSSVGASTAICASW